MHRPLLCFAIVASAAGFKSQATSSLSFDLSAAKNRPVSKVISLLKDMNAQLQEEAKADEEIYEQMACWCETNEKEKTKAIEEATQRIKDLTIAIESLTASSARLNQEIKVLEKEVGKNQDTLAKSTEIRMKDVGEFQSEEKDLLSAISSLKAAIIVLSKHQAASLLQTSQKKTNSISTVQRVLQNHRGLLEANLLPSQKRKLFSFVQQAPSAGSYAPASGEIIGILKQMKETFESNLAQTQKDETNGQSDYENLKATKEDEMKAGSDQLELKTQELATTDEKLADSKQDLETQKPPKRQMRNSWPTSRLNVRRWMWNLKHDKRLAQRSWKLYQKQWKF